MLKSGALNTGAEHSFCFNSSNTFWCVSSQGNTQGTVSFVKSVSGLTIHCSSLCTCDSNYTYLRTFAVLSWSEGELNLK